MPSRRYRTKLLRRLPKKPQLLYPKYLSTSVLCRPIASLRPQPPLMVLRAITGPAFETMMPAANAPPLPVIKRLPSIRRHAPSSQRTPTAWGGFISGDYQLAKRWFVGARYEQSEHPVDPHQKDTGVAGLLTFWPSEFSQLRAELRRRHYSTRDTATELLLQLQFAIGAHGAHPF